jgi:drug/metabolite transporter (DMT)-like permease
MNILFAKQIQKTKTEVTKLISTWLKNKKVVYGLMTVLVFLWGFDYVAAKTALNTLEPVTLVFFKYFIGAILLFVIRRVQKKKLHIRKKDIIILAVCSIFGQVMFFTCEYSAMTYLPVSIITIVIACVPMISIFLEIFIYKKMPNILIVGGILLGIIGMVMVIGVDVSDFKSGKWIGYALAFGAVIFLNVYNFLTEKLSSRYETFELSFMQLTCSMLLIMPYALTHLPAADEVTPAVVFGVFYLGIVNAGIGFSIYVIGISVIGPTPCALFNNFSSVTAAFFGWLCLDEMMTPVQMIGGAVIITSGAIVIWNKGKLDEAHLRIRDDICESAD